MKNEVIENKNEIQSRILTIRGVQVMLDRDLAALYGVEPKQLNRQVQRNIDRFPADFMFQLNKKEVLDLKCQIGTSSWGGDRYLPHAFTEQGVAMLSGVTVRLVCRNRGKPTSNEIATFNATRDPAEIAKVMKLL